MIVIGLTGSIGMGKSTTAGMLEKCGVPVHDSDEAVHEMMKPRGSAVAAIAEEFPIYKYPSLYGKKTNGVRPIKRSALGRIVFNNAEKLKALENITHPLVRAAQNKFLQTQKSMGVDIAALDIPLLFETGSDSRTDYTIVVSASYEIQRQRVLARKGMSEEKFHAILGRQMPDIEKCARADFVVHTGLGHAHAMKQVKKIVLELRSPNKAENKTP